MSRELLDNAEMLKRLGTMFERNNNYDPNERRENVEEAFDLFTEQRQVVIDKLYAKLKDPLDIPLYTEADMIAYANSIIGEDLRIAGWDGITCARCGGFIGCLEERETDIECTGDGGLNSHEHHRSGHCECHAVNEYLKKRRELNTANAIPRFVKNRAMGVDDE